MALVNWYIDNDDHEDMDKDEDFAAVKRTQKQVPKLFWWSHFPLFLMHYWAVTNQTTSQKNRQ